MSEAVDEIRLMIEEAKRLYDEAVLRQKNFVDKAAELIGGALEAVVAYEKMQDVRSSIEVVQEMITKTLSLLNLVPGISRDAIKTTGNAEGFWPSVLLRFEYEDVGARASLSQAINKLLDSKEGIEGHDMKFKRHGMYIEQAYPRAWKFSVSGVRTMLTEGPISQRPIDSEIDDTGPPQTESGRGHRQADKEMYLLYGEKSYLDHSVGIGINNCLFDAIAKAANVPPPSLDLVIQIGRMLGVPVGKMLAATPRNLDIILGVMGLDHRGAMVFYVDEECVDAWTKVGDDVLIIQHDGVNHFTAARSFMTDVHGGTGNEGQDY